MKNHIWTALAAFLLVVRGLSAQDFEVSGSVFDGQTDEPLIGVNIFSETNRLHGATTDFDGNFTMTATAGMRLVFRYVGYMDTVITVQGTSVLQVGMKPATLDLNTVVVSASRRKEKILDAPAAIEVVGSKRLEGRAAVSPQDYLKDISGVHIIKSGIQGGTPSVRGFGGYYTSYVMTLVDNRSAQVPNFRTNTFSLLSAATADLDRIEVLKGPASALYGPNTSEGVVHFITQSPIDHPKTTFSAGIGVRSAIKDTLKVRDPNDPRFDSRDITERFIGTIEIRHADTIRSKRPNLRTGYKVSTSFFRGLDWKYNDLNEPETFIKYIPSKDGIIPLDGVGDPLTPEQIEAGVQGHREENERDETTTRFSLDSRLDFRIGKDTELIFAGGFAVSSGIDMTPIGGLQQVNWRYSYFQTRLLWKDLFIQGYANISHSGDSYYLPTGGILVDRSKYYALQAQHSWEPMAQLKFVYGIDAFFSRADTRYTLNGRYEDVDQVNETGAYIQGDFKIHPRFTIVGATRLDYHNVIGKVFVSPRAAVLYKPATGQNLRLTFNRAFRTPGVGTYFIDVRQAELPTGIGIRALGTPNTGFQYSFAANPYYENEVLPQFRSPFGSDPFAYYNVGDQSLNDAGWQGILDAIKSELPKQFGLNEPIPVLDQLVDDMIASLLPEGIGQVDHIVKDLNSTTRSFQPSDWKNLRDIDGLKPVITYSYEFGYKGLLANFLMVSVDFYKTDHKNYIAPITFVTPGVLLDADQVLGEIGPTLEANLNDPDNALYNALLINLLDRNAALGGNNNGQAYDELSGFIHQAVSNLPIGTVTLQQANGPEMLLVSRNIGDVSVYGLEAGLTAYLSKNINLSGYYSWVDKDSIPLPGASYGFVALNAPKHRFSVGGSYKIEQIGLTLGARFNWQAGFPVNSGNFVGRVEPYHEMDVDLAWSPVFRENLQLTLSLSNVYNHVHQHFVGSPEIGMMAMFKASYTL